MDTLYAYDGQGTLRSQVEPGKQWSVFLTDALGRATAKIDSYTDGITSASEPDTDIITRQSYDSAGRVLQTTDPNGVATQYDYDVNGQIRQIVANVQDRIFAPASAVDVDVPTWLRYDRAGNQIEVKDANNHVWQTSYDALDQQIGTRDPLNHGPALTYDRGGRLRQQQRADGALVRYDYDLADRLTLVQAPDPLQTGQTASTSYTYRPDGARLSMVDVQQGTTNTTSYGYDTLKRLTAVTEPGNSTTNYRYNAAGQRDQMRYPDGTTLDYSYDVAGLLRSVSQNNTKLAAYTWSNGKLLNAKLRDGGTTLQYTYDSLRRQARQQATGLNAPTFDIKTTYDRVGQPIRVEETLSEGASAPAATATSSPASPTASPTASPSASVTSSATATTTASATRTATASATATRTATAITSSTATSTPAASATTIPTATASATATTGSVATATATASAVPTNSPTTTATSSSSGSLYYAVDLSSSVYLEAEAYSSKVGSTFRTVSDATRSNGQYVDTPDNNASTASATGSTEYLTYDLDVTNGGTVTVYLLDNGSDGDSDSFWVFIDGNPADLQINAGTNVWG